MTFWQKQSKETNENWLVVLSVYITKLEQKTQKSWPPVANVLASTKVGSMLIVNRVASTLPIIRKAFEDLSRKSVYTLPNWASAFSLLENDLRFNVSYM